ncbi:hypothetical protein R1flu_017246 [Riccia fluitans]|uniref:ribonuclease P n=1 Tax=Riccia fluitans TaxID=41844 RepID=A0ABD1XEA4_9MARC
MIIESTSSFRLLLGSDGMRVRNVISSPGFRVYFGRRGFDFAGRSHCQGIGHVHNRRSLSIVAAAGSWSRKLQDVSLQESRQNAEGDCEGLSSRPAQLKRYGFPEAELSRGSHSRVGAGESVESSKWRFKPKNNPKSECESSKNIQTRREAFSPKDESVGRKTAVPRAKVFDGGRSAGKVASIASGSSSKRIGRTASLRLNSDSAHSSVNRGSKTQFFSAEEETTITKGSAGAVRVATKTMSPHQKASGSNGEKERRPKQERRKKEKVFPPEAVLRRDLNMCSKNGDVLKALELYDKSLADGTVKWNQYNFNILLYLCSSASLGTLTARKSGTDRAESERMRFSATEQARNGETSECRDDGLEQEGDNGKGETSMREDDASAFASTSIVLSPEVMEQVANRGFEIYEHMKRLKVPPNEATLTAVARLAVARGDGDLAFETVKEMAALNLSPKLRSYGPALFTYCKNRAVEKAFEVDVHMQGVGVQLEEPELAALLQLCVDTELAEKVYSILHRLRVRVRALSPTTVAAIEQWFSKEAATLAGKGRKVPDSAQVRKALVAGGGGWHGLGWLGEGEWKQNWTIIDSEGVCRSCKEKLVTIDLDPKETENFASSLAKLACEREAKPNDFKKFQEWFEQHGPFDAIVDGANIGLYNQNFAQGGFNFYQLNAVVTALQDQGLAKRPPLIFLHHARTKYGAATTPQAQQLINKWRTNDALYTTPNGSNDDWYWMYAAVKNKCLLVTNDEMRDHLFQLLGTDFFPKWKERHQVRFSCTTRGPQFHLPPPYSIVIQESEKGTWHIPKIGGDDIEAPREWLCVTRPSISSASASSFVTNVDTPERRVEFLSPTREVSSEEFVEEQKSPSLKSESPESGTEESSVRTKRARLNSPSATLVRIRAADKMSENGPISY